MVYISLAYYWPSFVRCAGIERVLLIFFSSSSSETRTILQFKTRQQGEWCDWVIDELTCIYEHVFLQKTFVIARFLNVEIAQGGSYAPMCSVGTT